MAIAGWWVLEYWPTGSVTDCEAVFVSLGTRTICRQMPTVHCHARCRTCGTVRYHLCADCFTNCQSALRHEHGWCLYCTEAVAAHEVTEAEAVE